MTEAAQVHKVAARYLAPFGRLVRIENRLTDKLGLPDVYYVLRHVQGWLEEKIVPASGRPPKHFTLDQVQWGEEEIRAGGRWHLLARCDREWWLMDVRQARQWWEGAPAVPLIRVTGRFPMREVLDIIAPLKKRED